MSSTGSWKGRGDPGLQSERTTLAWTRTCLSYVGCSLLCAKLAAGATLLAGCVGLAGTAAAMVVLGVALRRYRDEPHASTGRCPAQPAPATPAVRVVPVLLVVGLTAMTVGLGAMVIVVAITTG